VADTIGRPTGLKGQLLPMDRAKTEKGPICRAVSGLPKCAAIRPRSAQTPGDRLLAAVADLPQGWGSPADWRAWRTRLHDVGEAPNARSFASLS